MDENYPYSSSSNSNSAQLLLAQQKSKLNTIQFDDDRKYRHLQTDVSFLLKRKLTILTAYIYLISIKIDLQFRKIEAKFQEEKLVLQQKHDTAVQKILDRKNTEIEELKTHFRKKTKEYEETIHKLERKSMLYGFSLIKKSRFLYLFC